VTVGLREKAQLLAAKRGMGDCADSSAPSVAGAHHESTRRDGDLPAQPGPAAVEIVGSIRGLPRPRAQTSTAHMLPEGQAVVRSPVAATLVATAAAGLAPAWVKSSAAQDDGAVDAALRESSAIQDLIAVPEGAAGLGHIHGADSESQQQDEGGDGSAPEVVGLNNPGYLCFLNASVQSLMGCRAFSGLLQRLRGSSGLLGRARQPTLAAFAAFMEGLKDVSSANSVGYASVRTVRVVLPCRAQTLSGSRSVLVHSWSHQMDCMRVAT
jgi:hypothetical protein